METEIKIDLVSKEQIREESDAIRITCGNICAWGNSLEVAIKAFDEALRQQRSFETAQRLTKWISG